MSKLDRSPVARTYLRGGLARGLVPFSVGRRQRCPYCHDGLQEGEDLVACSACRAVYHRECLGPDGECLTFGCPHAPAALEPAEPRGRLGKRLTLLGLLVTLLAVGWWLWHPVEHPVLPPPGPYPHPHVEPVTATVVQPLHGLVVAAGQHVPVRGRLHLSYAGQSFPRSIPVLLNGRPYASAPVGSDLTFSCDLLLAPGTHDLSLQLPSRVHGARVRVRPRPRPVLSGVSPQLDLAGTVRGSEVLVRGTLKGRGPVKVTVRGGGQSFSYDAQAPGPFATVITLPHVGVHRIEVSVRDARGHVRSTVGTIRRLN